ncbi:MAG: glycosyltransferase [Nitrospiraceae bacterium]|nr:MAG: glycosyltransferase [Nitrospiraceae bacterium]
MNNNALIIIAKFPEKESVKTRLKGLMPDLKRLELYVSLLEHTVQKLKSIPGADTFIAYAPASAGEYFNRFGTRLIALPEGDLGVRMFHAFREVFHAGYQKAALVGADIPDLSAPVIQKAFELLSDNDVVYGPARDGGYYLVGMGKLIKEVFEDVPWSSDQTLKKSLEQAKKSGCSSAFTETLSDIDTIEDVRRAGLEDMADP